MDNLPDPRLHIEVDLDFNYLLTCPGLVGFNSMGAGSNLEEALKDLIEDLMSYAEIWEEHLSDAPNHYEARTTVSWLRNHASEKGIRVWLINSSTTASTSFHD